MSDADIVAMAGYLLSIVAGGLGGAFVAWTYAPEIGGVYWPYIHAGIAIIGGIIGAHVLPLIVALLAFIVPLVLWIVEKIIE